MTDIYYGKKITKERDWNIEKGDIGWIDDKDLPESVLRIRFLYSEVIVWEEYKEVPDIPFFKNKEVKIIVRFKNEDKAFIMEDIESFDKKYEAYKQSLGFNYKMS